MSYKLFQQFFKEHLRQYLLGFLVIFLGQLALVILLREKFGGQAGQTFVEPTMLQVLFVLCLLVFVVWENLGILKVWINARYRMLPISASQLYVVNVLFGVFNQLVFFAFLVMGWFVWSKTLLPMFTWPALADSGDFFLGMASFSVSFTVLWQAAALMMFTVTQHFFAKLRPVIGIGCFLLISTLDSFINKIGSSLGKPVTVASDRVSYKWLWGTPFEMIFALLSLGLIVIVSIYLLKHYTEAESRKEHG